MSSPCLRAWILGTVIAVTLSACERERRNFEGTDQPSRLNDVAVSDLYPGGTSPPSTMAVSAEKNAYSLSEGKRLFTEYNCSGCHANGGGGMGPALIDDEWAYGHQTAQIYLSIAEGRPNGMPAWRGKIPDGQIWQLAAYVRSMSGLAPKDAAPSRNDDMMVGPSENRTSQKNPVNSGEPPGSVR